MTSALVVPDRDDSQHDRDENGRWLPGCAPTNPGGHNQWSAHSTRAIRARALRRIELALLRKLEEPLCVEALTDNWRNALVAPDLAPHTAKIASERVYPNAAVQAKIDDLARSDGGTPQVASADEWGRFADLFADEIPEGTILAAEGDAAGSDREGDELVGLAGET